MSVNHTLRSICFGLALTATMTYMAYAGQDIRFSDTWKFYKGDVANAQLNSFADSSWTTVCLPHTVNIEKLFAVGQNSYYLGYCWYRKTFTPDALFKGKKVFVEFEAAMQTALVYVNGTLVTTHLGGYTPFVLDITNAIQIGAPNVIAVQLDNSYSANFSPGKNIPDFCYFGGLYRNVTLHLTDSLHVTNALFANVVGGGGIFVTYPSVSTASATVQIKTHVLNECTSTKNAVVTTTLLAADGSSAGTASSNLSLAANTSNTFTQTITVANPKLWHPDSPNLYTVLTQVYDNTRLVDTMQTTVGIRTIQFSRSGFFINGQRYIFRGTNRHQSLPYIGNALPNSGQYRDALRLKEYGFDFVRMSHYVQPQAFVGACDKLGILSEGCLPGWQYTSTSTAFVNSSIADVRTMVRYYRNNPSVITYEVVHNESNDAAAYCTQANTAAHEEYPGDQMYSCGENSSTAINIFTPTSQANGRVTGASNSRPVILSEYGDWDYGGATSTSRVNRSQGEAPMLAQAKNHIESLNTDRSLTWLAGDALWSLFDYETCYGSYPLTSSGTIDVFRIPKFSAQFFKSQRDPAVIIPNVVSGPMVYIASHWTSASRRDSLRVYSNCDSVSLYLNGTIVGAIKGPDRTTSTTYLVHPPFSFTIPAFTSGTLRAEGKIAGIVRAVHQVKTPGTAKAVSITIDTANMRLVADGSDIALVYASVVDSNGTVLPTDSTPITFTLAGGAPADFIGNNPMTAQGGIATILLHTRTTQGLITITASATGLTSGTASVTSVASGTTAINTVSVRKTNAQARGLVITHKGSLLCMTLPHEAIGSISPSTFTLYTVQGKAVQSWTMPVTPTMQVKTNGIARGVYLGKLTVGSLEFESRVLTVTK